MDGESTRVVSVSAGDVLGLRFFHDAAATSVT